MLMNGKRQELRIAGIVLSPNSSLNRAPEPLSGQPYVWHFLDALRRARVRI
jgi:hypothetical protein